MERDDHEDPQSPLISQYEAHIHRQASKNMNTTPDDIPDKTVHTTTVHASEVKFNHLLVRITTYRLILFCKTSLQPLHRSHRRLSIVWKKIKTPSTTLT